jgi:FkbM family methyltransferase
MVATAGREAARAAARALLGTVLATPGGVGMVNRLHAALPAGQKRRFFYLFLDGDYRLEGTWTVHFAGRPIRLPLHRDSSVGWAAAVAFHGYDAEIHALYEVLVTGPARPRVVFDVGASYGLHALRFLAHGIRTIAFEPNPLCHGYFLECCALNGLAPELHGVALGDHDGITRLTFPSDATYLGTTAPDVSSQWRGRRDIVTRDVPVTRLDDFVARHRVVPDVVKIDTEGSELAVLRGARRTLQRARPLVLFESWPAREDRGELLDLLDDAGYTVEAAGPPTGRGDGATTFLASNASNFLARPQDGVAVPHHADGRARSTAWWIGALSGCVDTAMAISL